MKKQFLLLITAATLFSCKKEMSAQSVENHLQGQGKSIGQDRTVSQPIMFEIYNDCTQENITFSGSIRYTIKENYGGDKSQITYKINLTGVQGIGDVSGTVYHGGLASIVSVKTFETKPNLIFSVNYHATFTASGGSQIKVEESQRLIVNGQGDVVVIRSEPYTVTCKL